MKLIESHKLVDPVALEAAGHNALTEIVWMVAASVDRAIRVNFAMSVSYNILMKIYMRYMNV